MDNETDTLNWIVGEEDTEFDIAEIRLEAISAGIDITNQRYLDRVAAKRRAAVQDARQNIEAESRFERFTARADEVLTALGQLAALTLYLLIARIGLPLAIIPLWWAEMERVGAGIAMFDTQRAGLLAVTAVSAYMVLRIVRASKATSMDSTWKENGEGYEWSLRIWWQHFAYSMGLSRQWHPRSKSELKRLDQSIRALGWIIILLGTVGSMQAELQVNIGGLNQAYIESRSVAWLLSMAGGFVLTAGLLSGTHWLTGYLHTVYSDLRGPEVERSFTSRSSALVIEQAEDQAEAHYLRYLMRKRQELLTSGNQSTSGD